MDLYLAGMGRAGTTLLANLLTVPPSHWIITEPGITRGDMGEHVRQQAARFGLEIPAETWFALGHEETALARFQRVLAPRLAGLRWGVKEVNPVGYDELRRQFSPKKTLLAVRDIRDCALSLLEKHAAQAQPNPLQDHAWMHGRLLQAAESLVRLHRELPEDQVRVERYEDFVSSEARRAELTAWLDWPIDGDPGRCLDLYGRSQEAVRHAGAIGTGSLNRRTSEHRADWLAFADRLAEAAQEYQALFGYEQTPRFAPPAKQPTMRIIMGARHRDKLLQFLVPGTRMLEWGAGGSTVWLAENLPAGATLTSVEHDPKWFEAVRGHIADHPQVRCLLREATGELGGNATIGEEAEAPLQPFVHAVDGETFDLILVDGNARHACLRQAKSLLAPGGVVVLHDAQRAWYDEAKSGFFNHGQLGSCPDYPSPHLWWGGLAEVAPMPAQAAGALPLIVSFFTKGTEYEAEAQRLIASCAKLGLDCEVRGLENQGSWEANCNLKAEFIAHIWKTSGRPILWVDADAILHRVPELLRGQAADFAVHKCLGWQFASGTLFFNQTLRAGVLLDRWLARCRSHATVWDQNNLDLAWEDVTSSHALETLWLPEPYCRIFDLQAGRSPEPAVIEHFQASRRLKTRVSQVTPTPAVEPGAAHMLARMAARPNGWRLSLADSVTLQDHAAHPLQPGAHPGCLPHLVELFKAGLPAPARVLTVANGIGLLWRLLTEQGYEAYGLADSAAYLADVERFAPGRFSLGSPEALPHADGSFAAAFCFGLLEHLPEPELAAALAELRRVVHGQVFFVMQTTPDPAPRWPEPKRGRAWWLVRLAEAGFAPGAAEPLAPHAAYLTQETGCVVIRSGHVG